MRRDTLFDIDYGPAVLHQNDPGMLVKPVLPAYRHFELVRILTDEHSNNVQHYLDHECFILGGCLMANLQHIHQGRCHISFVKERGVAPPPLIFRRDYSLVVGYEIMSGVHFLTAIIQWLYAISLAVRKSARCGMQH